MISEDSYVGEKICESEVVIGSLIRGLSLLRGNSIGSQGSLKESGLSITSPFFVGQSSKFIGVDFPFVKFHGFDGQVFGTS